MIQVSQSPLPKLPAEFSVAVPKASLLTRDIRLRKHADYQRVYQSTRKQFSNSMTWFASVRPLAVDARWKSIVGPRVGLTAGKVLGKAHERNRIKRRLREIVRHHIQELPDELDLILHPKRSVMTMDFVKLDGEVLRIFRQAATQVRLASATDNLRSKI